MDIGHGIGHEHGHGGSDCHEATQNYHNAAHTFSDNVGHYIDSHIHSSNSNVYSAPVSLGDVARSGIDTFSASQEMNSSCN